MRNIYKRGLLLLATTLSAKADFLPSLWSISPRVSNKNVNEKLLWTRGGGQHKVNGDSPTNKLQKTTSIEPSATSRGGEVGGGGTATIPNEIFNCVKGIVGGGVLGLSAGIAQFGNAPSALLPAFGLIIFVGLMSAYCFTLVARLCSYTGATSYREAWERVIGPNTAWIPTLCCLLTTICATISYSIILSETAPKLLETIGISIGRVQALLGIKLAILLPLCRMKNLSSLAPFSLLGISGMAYTGIAMAIRYFGKGYDITNCAIDSVTENGNCFVQSISSEYLPKFGDRGALSVLSPKAFTLICMLSTAYMCHYNAPKFFLELRDNTIPRFQLMTLISFGISMLIMCAISALGFLTFGEGSNSLILNNYSTQDGLMSLSRVAVAISILFSYPLVFAGVRSGILDMMNIPMDKRTDSFLDRTTLALLGSITFLALFVVKDLGLVLSFGGATWGNAVVYLFPTYMFIKLARDKMPNLRGEAKIAATTGFLGLLMGILGTIMAVKSIA